MFIFVHGSRSSEVPKRVAAVIADTSTIMGILPVVEKDSNIRAVELTYIIYTRCTTVVMLPYAKHLVGHGQVHHIAGVLNYAARYM